MFLMKGIKLGVIQFFDYDIDFTVNWGVFDQIEVVYQLLLFIFDFIVNGQLKFYVLSDFQLLEEEEKEMVCFFFFRVYQLD